MYDIGSGSLEDYKIPTIVYQARKSGEPKTVAQMLNDNESDQEKTIKDVTNKVKNIRLWLTRLARQHSGIPILHSFWVFPQTMQVDENDKCEFCGSSDCNLGKIADEVERRFEELGLKEYCRIRYGRLGTIFDDVDGHNDMIAENILQGIITLQEIVAKEIAKQDGEAIKRKIANWRKRSDELGLFVRKQVPEGHPTYNELKEEVSALVLMIGEASEFIPRK
jgi:hypothetical protein